MCRLAVIVMVTFFLGCGTSAPQQRGSADSARAAIQPSLDLYVEVSVSSRVQLTRRSLSPHDIVLGGDHIELLIQVSQPAYIYVVHYAAHGWSLPLFPQREPRLIASNSIVRIPESGIDLVVDTEPAEEVLYILASRNPIEPKMCELLRVDCSIWRAKPPARGEDDKREKSSASAEREPPARLERPPTRDGKIIRKATRKIVHLPSEDGVSALLAFPFKHF